MEFDHTSCPNQAVYHIDRAVPKAFDSAVWPRKEPLSVISELPFTSLHTTQAPHIKRASEATSAPSSKQPSTTVDEESVSKPDPPKAKTACLRCRGKKSRCSGQRPCGGCTNDGLDCIWDDDGAKPKRSGRRATSAEDKRKALKGKNHVQVRSACTRCQHRKAKCTGTRPACAYCVERQLECTYDVAEGETRTNDLKRKLKDSQIKTHAFGRILAVMRTGNIYQATEVLARLRMGENLQEVLKSLPTSVASASPIDESVQLGLDRRFSA